MDFLKNLLGSNCQNQNPISTLPTHYKPVQIFHTDQIHEFQDAWQQAQSQYPNFQQAWSESTPTQNPAQISSGNFRNLDQFCEFWQNMTLLEEPQVPQYVMSRQNPFTGDAFSLQKASDYNQLGDIRNAILALEAYVVGKPDASDAWRLLGQLNAQNDQDSRAIFALRTSVQSDPYNLQSLLHLGVSLINQKDKNSAMQYLTLWIQNNPDYSYLKSEEIYPTQVVMDLFQQAAQLNKEDSQVFQVLGALNFMNKNYSEAVRSFQQALELNPSDHYTWNRLGAALANQGENLQAIKTYMHALQLRPGYVRTWANLGIAYANIDQMPTALRFYLSALALNPHATWIWNYVITAFTCMRRFDLVYKVQYFDPLLFADEFEVITHKDLPYSSVVENEWAREFD